MGKTTLLYATLAGAFAAGLLTGTVSLSKASAQGAGERVPFHKLLLVPPDDKDYLVTKVPPGSRVVVTDVIAYNASDGKGHKAAANVEAYVWLGGYADNQQVGLINRLRVLGNETEQWHLQTGMELAGAPELVVSSEKSSPAPTPTLVYVDGYFVH